MLPPERQLALGYARAAVRPAFATLLALDARFAGIVRATREPMVGQMRLTWWHDALGRLDTAEAPAEPLLRETRATLLPAGIRGAEAATVIEGWEVLLDPLDAAVIDSHGTMRGVRLYGLAARLFGGDMDAGALAAAGRAWALYDLAAHLTQTASADFARQQADLSLSQAFTVTWPARLRPLGALTLLQASATDDRGALAKFLRLTRFRATGR